LKILEFCLSPDLGGLEIFMVNCFKYFKKYTNTFLIISPDTKLDHYINESKYYINRNKFCPIIPAMKLAKFIDQNDIDIIHFHWTKDMVVTVLAKLLSKKKPKLIQTRNMHITRFKNDFYHKFLYRNISVLHAVTFEVKDELIKFIPHQVRPHIEVVYMGAKKNEQLKMKDEKLMIQYNISENDVIVGIVGRIEEGKGQWILIEALKKLDKNIKALIVGHTMDGTYLNNLKLKIKNLKLDNRVIFTGFTKQVYEHLSLCDVTVLASENETFGLVVVESMMCKVPVIATNKGGPLEIIENKIDGMFFNRTSDDLADKINILYKNRDLLNILSQNAYKKANKQFEYNNQLKRLYQMINNS